jgi:hypothetical protein
MILARTHRGTVLLIAAAMLLMAAPALAGQIDLNWNASPDSDIAGYRVFYDTVPDGYRFSIDVGNVTSYSLSGLDDCTVYYTAVKAIDTVGLMSEQYSNQISGYSHPEIASVTPSTVTPGETTQLTVVGSNFAPGATAEITSLTVNSSTVNSCGVMTVDVTVPADATGSFDLTVLNADASVGTRLAAVQISGSGSPFAIASISPSSGLTDIDADASIQIAFSHPLDRRSLKAGWFQIVKEGGAATKIDPTSLTLDEAGTTLTLRPAGLLQAGVKYSIIVHGGKKGVSSSSGEHLDADTTQQPGFQTTDLFETAYSAPSGSPYDPANMTALSAGAAVDPDSMLVLKFAENLNPTTASLARIRLLAGGKKVLLKNKTVSLSPDGRAAILEPATSLPAGASLEVRIKGGKKGVRSERGVIMGKSALSLTFQIKTPGVQGLGVAD